MADKPDVLRRTKYFARPVRGPGRGYTIKQFTKALLAVYVGSSVGGWVLGCGCVRVGGWVIRDYVVRDSFDRARCTIKKKENMHSRRCRGR